MSAYDMLNFIEFLLPVIVTVVVCISGVDSIVSVSIIVIAYVYVAPVVSLPASDYSVTVIDVVSAVDS